MIPPLIATTASGVMPSPAAEATVFSVLTWNVFFAPRRWDARMRAILTQCEEHAPDVLCFQEVLPSFLALLHEQDWLTRHDYVASTLDPQALAPYGVLSLAKRRHRPTFETRNLPSRMGRKLLLTQLLQGDKEEERGTSWTVGNVHLESLDSASVRAQQLELAGKVLRETAAENVVLCGDFKYVRRYNGVCLCVRSNPNKCFSLIPPGPFHSFCSERNYDPDPQTPLENDVLAAALPEFQDLWPTLQKDKAGYTFDGTRNDLIDMPRPDPQMRYDRVLWKKEGQGGSVWRPRDIELVGTSQAEGGGGFLSDHFALLATFDRET